MNAVPHSLPTALQVSYVRNTDTQQEEELRRLHEEVAMLGRINHPNIVRCLGATQLEGHINIFIEWMAGEGGGGHVKVM